MKLPLNIWFVKCEMFANPYDLIPTPAPNPPSKRNNGLQAQKTKYKTTILSKKQPNWINV